MEHLFKLKKDGKTVGYCKLIKYRDPLDSSRHWVGWGYSKNGKNWGQHIISFDIVLPFVTKDKNGKDVFAGDKMQSKDRLRKYEVVLNERQCNWFLRGLSTSWAVNEPTWKDYELIEDKENE